MQIPRGMERRRREKKRRKKAFGCIGILFYLIKKNIYIFKKLMRFPYATPSPFFSLALFLIVNFVVVVRGVLEEWKAGSH